MNFIINELNNKNKQIKKLEIRIERHRKGKMALLSFIDDVLSCARYNSKFYDNEELIKIISYIAEKIKRNLY